MKSMVVLLGLMIFSLQVSAQTENCQHVEGRLNEMASADQQAREEWNVLEQNASATKLEKESFQQRWRAIDNENLKQLKNIVALCGWPAGKKRRATARGC